MLRVLTDRRVLLSAAVIGGLLGVALWPGTVVVDLAPVSRGPLTVTVDEEGRTRVRDRFLVTAPVAGRVLRIELEPGDRVARNEVVARVQPSVPALLDPRMRAEAVAAVKSAEASLGHARAGELRARAMLAHAQRELTRSRHLHAAGATSAEDLDARETAASVASAAARAAGFAVRVASADVERAKARVATFRTGGNDRTVAIRAPADGVVLQRLQESARVVPAGEPLLEIGDPGQLEIVTDLRSSDAVRVKAGADAAIEQWGGDTAVAATVRRVEPVGFTKISALGTDEQRVSVILDLVDDSEDGGQFGEAYRVEVRIVLSETADVLKVPTSALVRDGRRWAVYVAAEGRARHVIVELGRHSGREAEVTSGLSVGAMVVVHPSDQVRDGVRIARRGP